MSAGSVVIDLLARTGSFITDLDRAGKHAEKRTKEIAAAHKKAAAEIESAFKNVRGMITGALGGITVGSVITKFIQETRDAEQEQAQLAAVLKSTGESAGWSLGQLNDMATGLAKVSTFSEGAINSAQTRLLSYTGIVGDQVPKAMQATIDMAARLGMDLNQSAETIGKALDVPSKGMASLSKQGFRFTEDQKKLAERLESTGKSAQAQGILLEALNSSYGGAAKAARDTFGGALAALQNNIDDLLTGDSGSMASLKSSVEGLNATLESEETRAAFQAFTGMLAQISNKAIQAANDVAAFFSSGSKGAILGDYALSEFGVGGRQKGDRLAGSNVQAANRDIDFAGALLAKKGASVAERERAQKLFDEALKRREYWKRQQREQALELVDDYEDGRIAAAMPRATAGKGVGSGEGGGGGGGGSKSKALSEAERYLENLKKQLQATKELSVSEALLADIAAGRLGKVTEAQKRSLMATAQEIDAAKAMKEYEELRLSADKARQDELIKTMQAQEDEAKSVVQGNEALRQEIALIGKDAEEQARLQAARIDATIAIKEQELATAQARGAWYRETDAIREQIKALQERKDLVGLKGTAEKLADDAKKADEFARQLGASFESAFEQAILDGGKLSDVLKGLGQDIAKLWLRQNVSAPIAEMLSGKGGGGKGGSDILGGLMGGIASVAKAIFGGWFADGGSPPLGKVSVVGERGPELFVPNTAGRIIPNHALGGGAVNLTINQTVGDVATMSMLAKNNLALKREISGALNRSRGYGGAAAV